MCVADIKEKLGARTVPLQLPIGAEVDFKGVIDLLTMKAIIWDGDDKDAKFTEEEIPADLAEKAAEYRAADDRGRRRDGRRRHGRLSRRQGARRRHAQAADPQGDGQERLLSDAVRLGLQEQGRAAAARRRGRLPALAGRPRGLRGDRHQDRRAGRAQAARRRSAVDAGLQDHGRPARRLDHVLPRLLGHGEERHGAGQHDARQERARRAHVSHARRRPRADRRGLRRRHHRAGGPQGYAHGRDAVRPATSPCCSRRWISPTPSSR